VKAEYVSVKLCLNGFELWLHFSLDTVYLQAHNRNLRLFSNHCLEWKSSNRAVYFNNQKNHCMSLLRLLSSECLEWKFSNLSIVLDVRIWCSWWVFCPNAVSACTLTRVLSVCCKWWCWWGVGFGDFQAAVVLWRPQVENCWTWPTAGNCCRLAVSAFKSKWMSQVGLLPVAECNCLWYSCICADKGH